MGFEPLEDWILELGESDDNGEVAELAEFLDVFHAGREGGVRREREEEGVNGGGVGGEERVECGEVIGGDDDGDGEGSESELVSEVEIREDEEDDRL